MKYMELSMPVVQKLVDYLVTKPWAEVDNLLSALKQAPVKEKEEPDGDRCLNDKTGSSESDSAGS